MSQDFEGKESVSPTQRKAILARLANERPADYLARLAAEHGLGEDWGEMTVLEFVERVSR